MESLPDVSNICQATANILSTWVKIAFLYSTAFSVLYDIFPVYTGNHFTTRKTVTNGTSTSCACDPVTHMNYGKDTCQKQFNAHLVLA